MVHHQSLEAPPDGIELAGRAATVGPNLRISGAQSDLRSTSAIAINPDSPNRILAASNIEPPSAEK